MEEVRAAGGVLWRPAAAGGIEVAVVHRPKYDDWSLPKGKLDPGEHPLLGALREIREETGYAGLPGRPLGSSAYSVLLDGREVPKTVRWWAVCEQEGAFAPGDEVDELRWLAADDAGRLLTAGRDAAPLRLLVEAGTQTATVLLVRHARAGDKRSWDGDDDQRPLDDDGRRQEQALARLLLPYRPARLLSAPLARCVDTLRPLGSATGCPLELDPVLSASAFSDDPLRTVQRLQALVRDGRTTVVCSQGEVLPEVLRELAEGGRCALPSAPRTPKGSVWALSFDARACLVDADLTADPLA